MHQALRSPRFLFTAAVALSAVTSACATPAPIVRLAPRSPDDVVWSGGRAVVGLEKDQLRVAAAFERQENDLLALRVEVQNLSGHPVDVDPAQITFTTCKGTGKTSCRAGDRVIDPEGMLIGLDADQSRERAEAANDRAVLIPVFFLSALTDVANAAHGDVSDETAMAAADADDNDARHAGTISEIESEKTRWSDVALRRTTIFPGKVTSGIVYVPVDRGAHLVWVQVQIGETKFPFCFRQEVFSARS